jgi:hypothetical protein
MTKENIVFVLGAGSHYPYGFPIMKDLKADIIKNFPDQYSELYYTGGSDNMRRMFRQNAKIFVDNFHESPIESIDTYLHLNDKFAEIGKAAIFCNLLKKEKESLNIKQDQDDWFKILFNKMLSPNMGVDSLKDFQSGNITFITFNYDRLLEHKFFKALKATYTQSAENEIIESFNRIKIIHVYGSLGELDVLGYNDFNNNKLRFGNTEIDYTNTGKKFQDGIKLIHERTTGNDYTEIKEKISGAKWIYFLGFGYGYENLNILNIPQNLNPQQIINGTGVFLGEGQIKNITLFLQNNQTPKGPEVNISKDCSYVLTNHLF